MIYQGRSIPGPRKSELKHVVSFAQQKSSDQLCEISDNSHVDSLSAVNPRRNQGPSINVANSVLTKPLQVQKKDMNLTGTRYT